MKLGILRGLYDESITITISSLPYAIGRSRSADFIIAHVNVSRNHCEIIKENTMWKVSDYSSSGTYINDSLVGKGKSVLLNNGDIIRFGPLESKLCWTFYSLDSSSVNAICSDSESKLQAQLFLDVQNKSSLFQGKNCFSSTISAHQPFEKNESSEGNYNLGEVRRKEISSGRKTDDFPTFSANLILEGKMNSPPVKTEKLNDERKSDKISELKKELHLMQSALSEMEEKNSALQGELASVSKSNCLDNLTDLMETEFQCTICSELFLMAVTLSCTHTFCKYCIDQWKKKQRTCPICRKKITNETRSLVVDNYIDKMIENLSFELKERREAILKERNKNEPPSKRSRLKTKNSQY